MDSPSLVRAKDVAAKHLGRRMRSELEIERFLELKGFTSEVITRVLQDFRRVGLLDDRAMARDYMERRLAKRPCGRLAVERELLARGVAAETAAEVLGDVYPWEAEREGARTAAARYAERLKALGPEDRARRSMALYYYTNGRPQEEIHGDHTTVFKQRPGEEWKSSFRQTVKRWTPPALVDLLNRDK